MLQTGSEILDRKVYPPVGYCIYCKATSELTKEHILPFGLGGTAILPKSSCKACARVTGHLEQLLLRGPMWPVRLYRALNSRTKHRDAPRVYALTMTRGGQEETIQLSLEEYPILLDFPVFPPPAIVGPAEYAEYATGIKITGVRTIRFGPDPAHVLQRLGAVSLTRTQTHRPVEFARVIAKVAYAFAVAKGALGLVEGDSFVCAAILGKSDDIGRYVGTVAGKGYDKERAVHRITLLRDEDRGLFSAEVRLFADSQAPVYWVVLGRLRG